MTETKRETKTAKLNERGTGCSLLNDDLQREPAAGPAGGTLSAGASARIQSRLGQGAGLSANLRKMGEAKYGISMGAVRVHSDETAHEMSRGLNARAFTVGKDIFLKKGLSPESDERDRKTMMHELAHVAQQGGRTPHSGALTVGATNSAAESAAREQSQSEK